MYNVILEWARVIGDADHRRNAFQGASSKRRGGGGCEGGSGKCKFAIRSSNVVFDSRMGLNQGTDLNTLRHGCQIGVEENEVQERQSPISIGEKNGPAVGGYFGYTLSGTSYEVLTGRKGRPPEPTASQRRKR